MTKTREYVLKKNIAINLRRQGKTYADISRELNIAKSTTKVWLQEEFFSNDEVKMIEAGYVAARRASRDKAILAIKAKTRNRDSFLKASAKATFTNTPLSRNHNRLLCATIFWCEGGKNDSGGIYFINSDPSLVTTFLSLFRASFDIDETRFRALIHLHSYHNPDKQLTFWSKVTAIPKKQFYSPYQKPNSGKNTRTGYPGCISVRYLDTATGKLLKMIYQELANKYYRGVR